MKGPRGAVHAHGAGRVDKRRRARKISRAPSTACPATVSDRQVDPIDVLISLAHRDALTAAPFAVLVAAVALWRRRRPLTAQRVADVTLSSVLLVMLAIRYGLLAAVTLASPREVLGPGTSEALAGAVVAVELVAFAAGVFAWQGGVGRKVLGALVMAVVALLEVGVDLFVLDVDVLWALDTGVSVSIAAAVLVMTAFHWSRRTATPNPLGGKGPPFSY